MVRRWYWTRKSTVSRTGRSTPRNWRDKFATLTLRSKRRRQEVGELRAAAARKLGDKTAVIFAFHEQFIADRKLRDSVVELIERRRYTGAFAFSQIMNERQRLFRNVADPYLKERVRDLFDIERRVLRHILGRTREDVTRLTEPVIIVANDITPSQAVSFDRRHVLAFAINIGGQTSHTAIIARMLGIPAVVALNDITTDVAGSEMVIVDGTNGIVVANPDGETVERYRTQQLEHQRFESKLRRLRDEPAVTHDGVPIQLLANIEVPEEAETGAIGVRRRGRRPLPHGAALSVESAHSDRGGTVRGFPPGHAGGQGQAGRHPHARSGRRQGWPLRSAHSTIATRPSACARSATACCTWDLFKNAPSAPFCGRPSKATCGSCSP